MDALILLDTLSLVTETRFNAVDGILLANRLVLAAPGDLTPEQKRSLRDVTSAKKAVVALREERVTRQPTRIRPYVAPFNASWSGLADVLAAQAALPPDVAAEKAARAEKLRYTLFPDTGAPLLTVDSATAWLEAAERLERIERLGLGDEIVALVGREHLVAIEKTTAALGEALGVDKTPRPAPSSASMHDALKRLSRAVARYARKLLADLDEDDAASVARFQSALAPIAEHKAALRTRSGAAPSPEADPDPATPAPTPAPTPTPTRDDDGPGT